MKSKNTTSTPTISAQAPTSQTKPAKSRNTPSTYPLASFWLTNTRIRTTRRLSLMRAER